MNATHRSPHPTLHLLIQMHLQIIITIIMLFKN